MINAIEQAVGALRKERPLILNLTNLVTMDLVANCLLAVGAKPIMSQCPQELEELIMASSAVYINIGTLDTAFINLSQKAVDLAQHHHKPIIFDPVGAGATAIRRQTSKNIAPMATIIKGNASEILALFQSSYITKGVEATCGVNDAKTAAGYLTAAYQTTVVISGPVDFITDSVRSAHVAYGTSLMQFVTGMGCSLGAMIAAFHSVIEDPYKASIIGTHYFNFCGQLSAMDNQNPGSFKSRLIDQLYQADFETMRAYYDQ